MSGSTRCNPTQNSIDSHKIQLVPTPGAGTGTGNGTGTGKLPAGTMIIILFIIKCEFEAFYSFSCKPQ